MILALRLFPRVAAAILWTALPAGPYSKVEAASSMDPLFNEARAAVSSTLQHPAGAHFLGVRIRNDVYAGRPARVVCGYVQDGGSSFSMMWVYLEPTKKPYILRPQTKDSQTTELLFQFCNPPY